MLFCWRGCDRMEGEEEEGYLVLDGSVAADWG